MRTIRILSVLVIAVLGAACGAGTQDLANEDRGLVNFANVAASSAAKGTYRFEMTFDFKSPAAPQAEPFVFTGEADTEAGRIHMEGGFSIPGAGELRMESVVVGETAYMKMGAPGFPSGWFKMDLADFGATAGANPLSPSDPSQFFNMIKDVSTGISATGSAEVRGVATTEYSATFDVDELLEQVPKKQRTQAREGFGDVESLPVKVYVGEDGLLYRLTMTMTLQQGSGTIRMDFFDYGAKVSIERPPKDEVQEGSPFGGRTTTSTFSCTGSQVQDATATTC